MNKGQFRAFVMSVALAGAFVLSAHAADNEDGQKPPVTQDDTPPAQPKECITDDSGFRNRDGNNEFFVELSNVCGRPQICVVKVYVIGSEGGKAGSGTLQLAAALDGVAMKDTWTMPTTENGGMATMSRSCTPS